MKLTSLNGTIRERTKTMFVDAWTRVLLDLKERPGIRLTYLAQSLLRGSYEAPLNKDATSLKTIWICCMYKSIPLTGDIMWGGKGVTLQSSANFHRQVPYIKVTSLVSMDDLYNKLVVACEKALRNTK